MPNRNASYPTDPQVLTLFKEELARAGAMRGLAAAGPALWPRFAGYYSPACRGRRGAPCNAAGAARSAASRSS